MIRILLLEDKPDESLVTSEAHPEEAGSAAVLFDRSLSEAEWCESTKRISERAAEGLFAADAVEARMDADLIARLIRDALARNRAEQALRESESSFREFLNITPNLMGVVEIVGDDILFLTVNQTCARYLGSSIDSVQGRLVSQFGRSRESIEEWIRFCLESERLGETLRRESVDVTAHGPRSIVFTVSPIAVGRSDRPRFSFIGEDITERKQAEAALKAREERFARAVNGSNSGIWDWDLRTDEVYFSPRYKFLIGYEEHEYPNFIESFKKHLHPDDQQLAWNKLEEHLVSRKPLNVDFRLRTKSGEYRWFNSQGQAEWDENGKPIRIAGSNTDITDRKRTEEALRKSEADAKLLAMVASRTDNSVLLTDAAGRIEWLNDGFTRLTGYQLEEVIGRKPGSFLQGPGTDPASVAVMRESIRRGERFHVEILNYCKSGREYWINSEAHPIHDEHGVLTHFIAIQRDVTERRQRERETRELTIQLQHRLDRLAALRRIDAAINDSFDLQLTLDVVIDEVLKHLNADAACIQVVDSDVNELRVEVGKGFRDNAILEARVSLEKSLIKPVIVNRQPVHRSDLSTCLSEFVRADAMVAEGFRSYSAVPLVSKGVCRGALEVYHRSVHEPDADWLDFLASLANQAAIAIEGAALFHGLQRSNQELSSAYDATIEGWSKALDLRDKETEGHSRRVTEMTLALAKKFGCSEVELANIRRGALLHDVGKLGIPDAILLKPGSLTDEEWVIMRNHPVYAYEWLSPIEFLRNALDIPYCHHEKWDGTGYPRKLAGEAIPLSARMFAAVDICDALRSDRPYRKGWPIEKVRSRISSLAGTHLDPRVVEVFLPMLGEESLPSMLDSRVPTVETAEEFVVLLDEKWRIQSASRGFLAAFLPSQDPRGVDFLSLIDSPSRERCRRLDKSTGSLELVHLTPSKSRREVTYSISNQAHPSGNLLLTAVGRSRSRPLEFLPVTPAVDRELLESRRLLSDRATASRRGLGFPVPRP